jgi:hypothetical protein
VANYHERDLKFSGSSHDAFEKAIAILEFLCWSYKTKGTDLIAAQTPVSAFGFGENITISFKKHGMHISSESRNIFQFFDLGKKESNVDKFLAIFKRAKLPFNESDFTDEKPRSVIERFLSGR